MSIIFDELAPLNKVNKLFKICFKSFFESVLVQKTILEVLTTWYFPYCAVWLADQWGGGAIAL